MSSAFRVTQRSMNLGVMANLQSNLNRMQKLQEQLSSGKAVNRPSDSPTDTVSALRYRADIRRSEQLSRNATDGLGWLATADQALTDAQNVIVRARELAIRGVNGAMGPHDREALATEVENLRQHALSLANTTYLGRRVFAGTTAAAEAYGPAGTYRGDTGAITRNVAPGVTVQVNLTGPEAFGPAGADLFAVLDDIATHLRSGDTTALSNDDLADLDTVATSMRNGLSAIGTRYHQVETMRDRTDNGIIDLQNGLAEAESLDLPKTITDLKLQEVAYQAALSATARVVQPSLVDFLR